MKLVHDASKTPKQKEPENPLEAAALQLPPAPIDFDLSGCVRLLGENPDVRDNNDPTVLSGATELGFRKLIAAYGFDRLPLTYGEVEGLTDYVELLWIGEESKGVKHVPGLATPQESFLKVLERKLPWMVTPAKLFYAGDIAGLRAYHKENDTLTQLGLNYKEPAE